MRVPDGANEEVTDLSGLPEHVREREQDLARMLAHAGVGSHWLAPDGRILWANQAELDLLGYSGDEYVGHFIDEFYSDPQTAKGVLTRLAAGQALGNYEVELLCKNGRVRQVLIDSDVLFRDGEVLYFRCITRDVSELVTAREALRYSQEQYRAFIRNSSEGIWRFELDVPIDPSWPEDQQVRRAYDWAYLAECNDAMARMYGHNAASALVGARLSDLFVRSDPKNDAFLREFIRSGYELRDAESRERGIDGEDRYFLNSLIGVIENGRLLRAWGTQRDVSRQRRIQSALRESEERFSRFMNHLPGAAWIKSLDGRYVYVNPEAERVFGIKCEALRGRSDFDVFPASTASQFTHNDKLALQFPGGIQTIETLAHADGPHESVVNKFPIPDEQGAPVLVGGVAIDITEQRRAQAALARSQERLELATRSAGIGTFDWEIQTGRVIWNEQEEALFGLSPGTFEGTIEHWAERVHPEDLPAIRARISEAMAQGAREMTFAFRINRADGVCRWIEGAARLIYAADDIPLRMVGVNIDVTDRRQAETGLKESEERLRLAADAGRVGLWDWDILSNRIVWSDRVYEFHGLSRESFGGRVEDFAALIHPNDSERVKDVLARALQTQEPYDLEFRTVRPDGQVRWLSTRASVVYDPAGKPVRMFGAVLDTTERRDREERLRLSNEELEEFAFVVSHDLREPLRMVNAYTQLLLRRTGGGHDPDLQMYRQFIEDGVRRMEALIHDLLAYSRVIHGDQLRRSAKLQVALERAICVLQGQITETGAEIVSDTLPEVRGEETQYEQVFQNLISNSLKYRRADRKPAIQIRAAQEGQQVQITLTDNGIGFDPQYSEYIFGLFKRLHRDDHPGTGLGLAICKRIIERVGGRIWAESEPGVGATFTFTVPLERSPTQSY